MGNQQPGGQRKKQGEKKKYQPPLPTTIGKRKNKHKGPATMDKIPTVTPHVSFFNLLAQKRD